MNELENILKQESGIELTLPRALLDIDNQRKIASSPREIGILVFRDTVRLIVGNTEEVNALPLHDEVLIFKIHSHPETGGDQPSIADLNSAELFQIYSPGNENVRFFIITVRGITEYRIPKNLENQLRETGDEFRDYYTSWLKRKFGDKVPDGKTISTVFNIEHSTFKFYPWDSTDAVMLVNQIQGLEV